MPEINQTEKAKYCMISFISEIKKKKKSSHKKKIRLVLGGRVEEGERKMEEGNQKVQT